MISYIDYELNDNHDHQNTKITMSSMIFMAMSFRCGLIFYIRRWKGVSIG